MVDKEQVLVITSYISKDLYSKIQNVKEEVKSRNNISISLSKVVCMLIEKGIIQNENQY